MSTAATTSIGDTAAAVPDADLWFQLYMPADHDAAAAMVDAAGRGRLLGRPASRSTRR